MELMQPKSDDPAQQQSNVILKLLPLMIGWFSLSVPSALSVYWVVNNIVTTATSVLVRSTMKVEPAKTGASDATGAASMSAPAQSIFSPPRERPAGFGDRSPSVSQDGVKPITAMDAEIVEEEDDDDDGETAMGTDKKKKRGKGGKKKKN